LKFYCADCGVNFEGIPFNEGKIEEVFKMPRGNGTGPMGMGPMTGRGAGYCAGYSVPGYVNPAGGRGWFGFGRGFGRGRGRGFGRGFAVPPTAREEADILKEESELLKQQLQDIQERINMLDAEKNK
jgi:hypothetical protein